MAICCFAGHNMLYDDTIKQLIYKECIKHIEKKCIRILGWKLRWL